MGSKVQGSEVRSSMQISTVDTSNLSKIPLGGELWLRLWVEKANSWHNRLIHTKNGGIIRLIVPQKKR